MKIFLLCVSLAFELVHGLNDGLCPTPPMGFSSWNAFKRDINQDKIISTVDAIKRLGLDKYGYNYVVIDDLWSTSQRNPSNQKLQGVKLFYNLLCLQFVKTLRSSKLLITYT